MPALAAALADPGGTAALAWTALKVGALAFGGGFVIVPLMQADAVSTYHWMTHAQFLNAVALGQLTPGPVTQTVAAVGYAAGGVGDALLASAIAFAPSFSFVLLGGERFERLLSNSAVRAFLAGAAPAAAGAIVGFGDPAGVGDLRELAVRAARRGGALASRGSKGRARHARRVCLCRRARERGRRPDRALRPPATTRGARVHGDFTRWLRHRHKSPHFAGNSV